MFTTSVLTAIVAAFVIFVLGIIVGYAARSVVAYLHEK